METIRIAEFRSYSAKSHGKNILEQIQGLVIARSSGFKSPFGHSKQKTTPSGCFLFYIPLEVQRVSLSALCSETPLTKQYYCGAPPQKKPPSPGGFFEFLLLLPLGDHAVVKGPDWFCKANPVRYSP
jgi:hypothetical protein